MGQSADCCAVANDITPDGKFIGIVPSGQSEIGTSYGLQIQVVLNWTEELKQRVPIK